MPFLVPHKGKRKVKKMASSGNPSHAAQQSPENRDTIVDSERIEQLSDSELDYEDLGALTMEEQSNMAYIESVRIPIRDSLETATSEDQGETLQAVLPFLEGNPNEFPLNAHGLPQLQRKKHVAFLKQALGNYPPPFAMMEASRPWLVYWSLQGLSALGYDISEYRER